MSSHLDVKAVPCAYSDKPSPYHLSTPTALADSPEMTWIASGFEDGTIPLVHSPNSHTRIIHRTSKHPIRVLAFSSSDPPLFACADSADRLTAWRIHPSQPTDEYPEPKLALEPFARACPGPAYILSPPSTETSHITVLAWSADTTPQILACYAPGYLFSWYPLSGRQTFDRLLLWGEADGLWRVWAAERRTLQATF
ncbi:hypothetical protein VTO73DRAFT_11611 [Trametes versicolor]